MPEYIFHMLVSVMCLGIVISILWKGLRRGLELTWGLLLIEVIFIIYCFTLIFRTSNSDGKYNIIPFWSYRAILDGQTFLLAENIMNVLVFIPIGLLMGLGFCKWSWRKTIGIGCLISVSIELLQLLTKRGFCETDDVIHNTLGCMIGYILVKGSRFQVKGYRR